MGMPKLSLVFGPWNQTEFFVNAGQGFHSNDARGVTATVDPKTGAPVAAATPLVRATGAELGSRTEIIPNLQSSIAFWYLKLGSELVFVGDEGTTEPSRPSKRIGVEWSNHYTPSALAAARPRPCVDTGTLCRRRSGRQPYPGFAAGDHAGWRHVSEPRAMDCQRLRPLLRSAHADRGRAASSRTRRPYSTCRRPTG